MKGIFKFLYILALISKAWAVHLPLFKKRIMINPFWLKRHFTFSSVPGSTNYLSSCLGRLLVFAAWMCATMLRWVCMKGSGCRGHTRGKSLYNVFWGFNCVVPWGQYFLTRTMWRHQADFSDRLCRYCPVRPMGWDAGATSPTTPS